MKLSKKTNTTPKKTKKNLIILKYSFTKHNLK